MAWSDFYFGLDNVSRMCMNTIVCMPNASGVYISTIVYIAYQIVFVNEMADC